MQTNNAVSQLVSYLIPRDESSGFCPFNFLGNGNENSEHLGLWYFWVGLLWLPYCSRSCLGSIFLQVSPVEVISVHIDSKYFLPWIHAKFSAKSYAYQLKLVLLSTQALILWARKTAQGMWTFLCDKCSPQVGQVPWLRNQMFSW